MVKSTQGKFNVGDGTPDWDYRERDKCKMPQDFPIFLSAAFLTFVH